MTTPVAYPIKFQAGTRTFLTIHRRMIRVSFTLMAVIAGEMPGFPPLADAQGYAVTSLPEALLDRTGGYGLLVHVRQLYTRYFAEFGAGFDAYMAHFSSRTRSTLNRKCKRFAALSGGTIDIRCYRTPGEIETFATFALPLSRRSYQHRLLDAGLPDHAAAHTERAALAAADRVRAFLLFQEGRPIAYLYLPVYDETLIYAHLGYDRAEADLSPGTVLQVEAIRILAEEGRYTRLDFTEGEGQHKRLFSTGGLACADVLMLRPTLANRLMLIGMKIFDRLILWAKAIRR